MALIVYFENVLDKQYICCQTSAMWIFLTMTLFLISLLRKGSQIAAGVEPTLHL